MPDTRFKKGQSGNPKGRPKGSRHKTTLAIEALLDGEGEEITRKAIEKAKEGDMAAIRVCLDRIAPPRKDRHIEFALPEMQKASDAATSSAAIMDAVSSGELTPSEAGEILKIVESYARTLQASDFEERLERLERDKGFKR
jgi:Family of unknown function (DUF5681)